MQKAMLKQQIAVSKNYNAVDLMRFFCSLMVCSIHIRIADSASPAIFRKIDFLMFHWVARLAVPFFFIAAGFFLFRSMELYSPDTQRIKKYCFKLLRLNGVWFVLLTTQSIQHLWYLGATVAAVLLLTLLLRYRVRLRYLLAIACGLYAIGLLGETYVVIIEPLEKYRLVKWIFEAYKFFFESTRNGIFMGFIFVLIGAALAKHPIRIKMPIAWGAFFVSMAALLAEAIFVKRRWNIAQPNMYIFLPIATFLLFYIVINIKLKDRPIYRWLREMSVLIYFVHYFFIGLIGRLFLWDLDIPFYPYTYFAVAAASVLTSAGILLLAKKFRPMRYLYS